MKGMRKKKKRIIPMKLTLGFTLWSIIGVPVMAHFLLSCACLLLYRSMAPPIIYLFGLVVGLVTEIDYLLRTNYGVLVKNDLITYMPKSENVIARKILRRSLTADKPNGGAALPRPRSPAVHAATSTAPPRRYKP